MAALVVVAYLPALHGGFILDDDVFLTKNALIRASDGLYRFWCTTQAADYWPLTSSTLWLEWRAWGMDPTGYHVANVCLHLVECLLLWRLLARLNVPGAFLCSLVFAVHPLNVESVAWITQRKNLMAMLFFLAGLDAYLNADPSLATGDRPEGTLRTGWYAASLAAFCLALLSKASVAPLPAVLLGLIIWRRRPSWTDAMRLAPFVALAAGAVLVNVWFQRHGSGQVFRNAGIMDRLVAAGTIPWFYLWKTVLPVHLSLVYPQWNPMWTRPLWWLGPLGLAVAFVSLGAASRAWTRQALFALAYFCVMLAPVLGLTDVAYMRFALVADHYAHLALIGPLVMVVSYAVRRAESSTVSPRIILLVGSALAVLLAVPARTYARSYRDAESLYERSLEENPRSSLLHNNLGFILQGQGRKSEALGHYLEAVRLNPRYAEAHNNLGELYSELGQYTLAVRHCEEANRLRPEYPDAQNNLGVLYARGGRIAEGLSLLSQAIKERPDFAEAHYHLGVILRARGNEREAAVEFDLARQLRDGQ